MSTTRNIAPIKLEMLFVIVHDNKAAYYANLIQSHQANLQFTMPCKGTTHLILNYLGLVDRPKSLILSLVREDESGPVLEHLKESFQKGKDLKGVAFTVPLSSMIGTLAYGFLSNEKQVKEEA